MDYVIKTIRLSLERSELDQSQINLYRDKTDVIVEMENGDIYVASFFTYEKINDLILEHRQEGNFLNGRYFWVDLMVLVEDCSKATITEVINHLIDEGDFQSAFQKI